MDDTSYINTLKEMILDEGNLATYISISKHLGVHVNESKKILQVFLDSIRRELPQLQLNVNYLLSGIVDQTQAKLTVCAENDLEKIKKSFKVIYFQHIYSISKGLPQTDHAAFVTLNKYSDFSLCSGLIKSEYCIKRSSKEIDILKSSSQEVIDQKTVLSQKKTAKPSAPKINNTNGDLKLIKTESQSEKPIKKEIVSPQKENINKQSSNKSVPQKGIAGFFNKQNGNPKKKENKAPEKSTRTSKLTIKKQEKNVEDKMDIDDNAIVSASKDVKANGEVNGKDKILNQIKKNSKVDKKRKRVLHVSDSESEGENDPFGGSNEEADDNEKMNESDDEIPPTPAANNLKITTGIVNPRKKRKVVDKTYMSDDGYIITKREEVYESCSDGETNTEKAAVKKEVKQEKVEVSPKSKPSEIKTKKKISPPQKGKQSSIMNFFKKS